MRQKNSTKRFAEGDRLLNELARPWQFTAYHKTVIVGVQDEFIGSFERQISSAQVKLEIVIPIRNISKNIIREDILQLTVHKNGELIVQSES